MTPMTWTVPVDETCILTETTPSIWRRVASCGVFGARFEDDLGAGPNRGGGNGRFRHDRSYVLAEIDGARYFSGRVQRAGATDYPEFYSLYRRAVIAACHVLAGRRAGAEANFGWSHAVIRCRHSGETLVAEINCRGGGLGGRGDGIIGAAQGYGSRFRGVFWTAAGWAWRD